MKRASLLVLPTFLLGIWCVGPAPADDADNVEQKVAEQFTVRPIGWIRKADGRTTIVLKKEYQPYLSILVRDLT